jgi:hypothetical protein
VRTTNHERMKGASTPGQMRIILPLGRQRHVTFSWVAWFSMNTVGSLPDHRR